MMAYERQEPKDFTLIMTPSQRDALLVLIDAKANRRGAAEMWSMLRAQLLATVEFVA